MNAKPFTFALGAFAPSLGGQNSPRAPYGGVKRDLLAFPLGMFGKMAAGFALFALVALSRGCDTPRPQIDFGAPCQLISKEASRV